MYPRSCPKSQHITDILVQYLFAPFARRPSLHGRHDSDVAEFLPSAGDSESELAKILQPQQRGLEQGCILSLDTPTRLSLRPSQMTLTRNAMLAQSRITCAHRTQPWNYRHGCQHLGGGRWVSAALSLPLRAGRRVVTLVILMLGDVRDAAVCRLMEIVDLVIHSIGCAEKGDGGTAPGDDAARPRLPIW